MSAQTQPAAPRREDAPLGVLVGVDGSDQSVSAARWAQREAGLRGEPLTLVTAYSIPAYGGSGADAGGAVLDASRLRAGGRAPGGGRRQARRRRGASGAARGDR